MLNLGSGALGTRGQSKSGCTSASCLVSKYIGIIKEELLFFFFSMFPQVGHFFPEQTHTICKHVTFSW